MGPQKPTAPKRPAPPATGEQLEEPPSPPPKWNVKVPKWDVKGQGETAKPLKGVIEKTKIGRPNGNGPQPYYEQPTSSGHKNCHIL